MAVLMTLAIIFPALLMLQPVRLWRVLKEEKAAVTPRQRFRGEFLFVSIDETVSDDRTSVRLLLDSRIP